MRKFVVIIICSLFLSYLVIKVDRIFKPTIAFKYYFTDDLKNDKELMSLLTKEGVLVTKNKSYAEVRALKYISNFFSNTSSLIDEKDFQIVIDLPKESELSFYVINDDVGLDANKLIEDNEVRKHLNPSRVLASVGKALIFLQNYSKMRLLFYTKGHKSSIRQLKI